MDRSALVTALALLVGNAVAAEYATLHANSWLVNTDGHYNSYFLASSDITTSAEDTSGSAWKVTHNRIPNYYQKFTQDIIDELNDRPKASSDFSTGETSAVAGEYYEWGSDIGYAQGTHECNGYWPPGPECPETSSIAMTFDYTPKVESSADGCFIGLGAAGYFVNGASLYGLSDGTSYNSNGDFLCLAAEFEPYDLDICNGHAANGDYHHHHYPKCLQRTLNDTTAGDHSPVYGWLFDSYPIYGPYHADNLLATPCWQKRDYFSSETGCADGARSCKLVDPFDYTQGTIDLSSSQYGPSLSGTVETQSGNSISSVSGIYYEDYFYNATCLSEGVSAGLDHYLDEYNGHEHGDLGYHYHVTIDADGAGVFPYLSGPKYRGCLTASTASAAARKLHSHLSVEGGPPGPPAGISCMSSIDAGSGTGASVCAN